MATNFPTSLDTNPGNPTANETLAAAGHANLHDFLQDAMIAVETYLGVTNSAVTSSITYILNHLTPAKGGTGIFTYVKGQILAAMNATTLVAVSVGTDGQILTADSTAAAGVSWQTSPVPAGSMIDYAGSSAPTGWLAADGSAISRSTYATLFAAIGTTWGVGDGSTTFNIPDTRGRVSIGKGTGTKVATFASRASNVITVTGLSNAANNEFQTGAAVLYVTTSGAITGLTNNTTYYIIRISNTTFSLAATLADAQAGNVIALSSNGSGVQTFTEALATRTLADTGGEENHSQSPGEVGTHLHVGAQYLTSPAAASGANLQGVQFGVTNTGSAGSSTPMNVMQPFYVPTKIIKT